MKAKVIDLNDDANPLNGTMLATSADIRSIFERIHNRPPFMFQIQIDDGRTLDVGVATDIGCVQRTPSDGMPPYQMATTPTSPTVGQGDTEFSVGGTATPIDNRYCIPLHTVKLVVETVLDGGELPEEITWEDV